jgi:hypothetical protein
MLWLFTLARSWLSVMSLSQWAFTFTVGLCVDDGDRPELRIHLQLCNSKMGCRIIDKRKFVNSTRILWAIRPKIL